MALLLTPYWAIGANSRAMALLRLADFVAAISFLLMAEETQTTAAMYDALGAAGNSKQGAGSQKWERSHRAALPVGSTSANRTTAGKVSPPGDAAGKRTRTNPSADGAHPPMLAIFRQTASCRVALR
jgi:hypothetical protein